MTEEIKETGDYPFKSWDTFFEAFNEILNTEFAGETYPKYVKILEKYSNYDVIITMFRKYNLNINDGLIGYIYALCHTGTRYADDVYDSRVIKFFIKNGAKFPTHLLFDAREDFGDIDEECFSYDIRATILDDFGQELKLNVSIYTDWEKLEAENIEDQDIDNNKIDEDSYCDLVRFKHLKYLSSYLQEFKKSP